MKKAILHLKKADPVIGRIIEQIGPFRMEYREPGFHALARAIVYQQLNGTAAGTIFSRFVALLEEGQVTADAVLRVPPRKLRRAGLSAQKAAYLRDLARKTASGVLPFERLAEMADDEVIAALTEVKGVGVWTAHMFLIFALRRPNILAVGDYGVRAAVKRAYGLDELPKPPQLTKIAEPWHPYCSVACWYLWRSLQLKTP